MRKSQTSTEYLVILAVVIVIALLVVGILGGIPGIGGGASRSTSKAAWSSQPIGVTNWVVDTLGTHLELRNNLPETVTINSITLEDKELSVDRILAPGEKLDVYHFGVYYLERSKYELSFSVDYTDLSTKAGYIQNDSRDRKSVV